MFCKRGISWRDKFRRETDRRKQKAIHLEKRTAKSWNIHLREFFGKEYFERR